ncbi:MAG: carboxyl transferase domain-containing protein [Candidatus Nanopelagicales bacterium]
MRLRTHVDTRSAEYAANRAAMAALVEQLESEQAKLHEGGGERYVQRHRDRGKMLPRERIQLLLDRDAPFLELMALAGWGSDDPLGGGVITGIGVVEGVECLIGANDPTVKGGAQSPTSVRKMLRAQEIAHANRLPLVNLTESGGADLPKQADIFVPGGEVFRNLTQLSRDGVPTITLVFGSSTAGGAYLPGLSDYTVLQQGSARVFLGGPPLVKMAIDEDVDDETLGGADMHARVSGLADYLAFDEPDALRLGRQIVRNLRWHKLGPSYSPAAAPAYDIDELLGVVPEDARTPYDIREVLARIVDGSVLEEFKPLYGAQLVCGWASLHGYPIGVLANNGILFSEEAQKGAQFIQLCNRQDTPLVFLQNITGFMVGSRYERAGIIKHGAMLINAVSNSTVPHITLMLGASYGAGNYGMSGRAFDPRFVFSWPNSRIAVMGPKQLAGVLSIVQRQRADKQGLPFDDDADAQMRSTVEGMVEEQSSALFATGRIWDDGIIDPRDSRIVLGLALSATHSAPVTGATSYGVFRM